MMGPPHSMILSALSWSPHGFVFSIPRRPHTEWWFAYILFTTTVLAMWDVTVTLIKLPKFAI